MFTSQNIKSNYQQQTRACLSGLPGNTLLWLLMLKPLRPGESVFRFLGCNKITDRRTSVRLLWAVKSGSLLRSTSTSSSPLPHQTTAFSSPISTSTLVSSIISSLWHSSLTLTSALWPEPTVWRQKLYLILFFMKNIAQKTSLHDANYCMHTLVSNYHLIVFLFCVFF